MARIGWLFRANRLARGCFPALGRPARLPEIEAPIFVLAAAEDEVVTAGAGGKVAVPGSERRRSPGTTRASVLVHGPEDTRRRLERDRVLAQTKDSPRAITARRSRWALSMPPSFAAGRRRHRRAPTPISAFILAHSLDRLTSSIRTAFRARWSRPMSATTAASRWTKPSMSSSRKDTAPTRSALKAATAQRTLSAIRPCERTDYSVDGDRPVADRNRQRCLSRC